MDILNFISWIKGKRQLNVVDPAKTLLPIGIKDGRRDLVITAQWDTTAAGNSITTRNFTLTKVF